ncbi:MAG: hypothetical protein K2X50_00480 [Gammaproteobacteria bacterium]|nr:hypothetical protein [Gammaproteobacteria bacterium]
MILFRPLIKKFISMKSQLFEIILFILSITMVFFCLAVVIDIFFDFDLVNNLLDYKHSPDSKDPVKFHAAVILILTIAILLGSWRQIYNANKISKNDFIMRIDQQYSSLQSIKARAIIHKIYREIGPDSISRQYRITETARKVALMRTSTKKYEMRDFIYLMNFLECLETISFFANNNAIGQDDLKLLSGPSIKFYYQVFKLFITERRTETDNNSYYVELEKFIQNQQEESL